MLSSCCIFPDVVEVFNSTSSYLHDLLNIDNRYFEQMVIQIYPDEPQFNKTNSSDTESKKGGKGQESIQSGTTPDPGYQWESDNFTVRHHKRESRSQPFLSR